MPAERPLSKASENRRATKPIMEKRRRARINQCLSELKTLILDALNKDPSRHSKLEKADILEMTVHHLQNIQRQQMAAAISTDSSVLNKFKAGFSECATEVSRYVNRLEGVDPAMRQRLLAHLSNCLTSMSGSSHIQQKQPVAFGGQSFPSMLHSLSVQIPAGISTTVGIVPAARSTSTTSSSSAGDVNNNNNSVVSPPPGTKLFAGLSVIPSRLPNGDFAFLLPSQAFHLPSASSGPDRGSQSSWTPASPSPRRSPSPDAMSEGVLSPTCSDAGSDVFLEASYRHPAKDVTSSERSSPKLDRHHPFGAPRLHPGAESESVWRPW